MNDEPTHIPYDDKKTVETFSLKEIADWGINDLKLKERRDQAVTPAESGHGAGTSKGAGQDRDDAACGSKIRVTLPAMQRGLVWKPYQIEGLWDSLIRQLPVGTFLLHPVNPFADNVPKEYHLIDGQQRATAIRLGFNDPWSDVGNSHSMALWIDLAAPSSEGSFRDRAFNFRLLTRYHPWGYQRNQAKPLDARTQRAAFSAFSDAADELTPGDGPKNDRSLLPWEPGLNLAHCLPWEAEFPLPFPKLLKAAIPRLFDDNRVQETNNANWEKPLQDSLNNLFPFNINTSDNKYCAWKSNVNKLFNDNDNFYFKRLNSLIIHLQNTFENILIPAIKIPIFNSKSTSGIEIFDQDLLQNNNNKTINNTNDITSDYLETLFVRVNSAGTAIEGEELLYSIFKSNFPEYHEQKVVETIGANAFVAPSKVVALIARLALANLNKDKKNAPFPAAIRVGTFRTLIRSDENYRAELKRLVNGTEGRDGKSIAWWLFAEAREIMAGGPEPDNASSVSVQNSGTEGRHPRQILDGEGDVRLGSILTKNILEKSNDLYFFLLWWIYHNKYVSNKYNILIKESKEKIPGIITAIAIFGVNIYKYISSIWKKRDPFNWEKQVLCDLDTMFDAKSNYNWPNMLFLPKPSDFSEILNEKIIKFIDKNGFEKLKNWSWKKNFKFSIPSNNSSYTKFLQPQQRYLNVWTNFCDKIYKDTDNNLLLYTQRYWLDKFFPGYNPALLDPFLMINKPYDIDHIFPTSYIYYASGILSSIRELCYHTPANKRAWPLELNRADSDHLPYKKLSATDFIQQLSNSNNNRSHWAKVFNLPNAENLEEILHKSSGITNCVWNHLLQVSDQNSKYTNFNQNLTELGDISMNLLLALTTRLCQIYCNWHTKSGIGSIYSDY